MKKIIAILVFSVAFAALFATSNISGRLKAEMRAKLKAQNGAEKTTLIQNAPSIYTQLIFLHFSQKPNKNILRILKNYKLKIYKNTWIPPCKNHPTGFLVAKIPVDLKLLNKISNLKFIKKITSAERTLELHNDLAAVETGVSQLASNSYNLTGEGVRIAVIDSGFEIDNPDLPEPIFAVDYSNYIAEPDSDFTVSNETTHTGHGTHVAGTILGQGTNSNGVWKGMAPDADFIALKVAHDNGGSIFFEPLIHSVYAASFYYDADLINISLGGWDEYHDGSSEDCQVVDLVYENGTVCFISTGNDADDDYHFSGIINAMDVSDYIPINYSDTTFARDINYNVNLVWYDGPDTNVQTNLDMVFYNSNLQPLAIQTVEEMTQSPRGTQSRYGTATVFGNNTFYVRILNQSSIQLRYHLYIDSFNGKFAQPDSNYTIAAPACADNAVSIASYCSRIEWTNWQGLPFQMLYSTLYDIAPYSNRGPRIDDELKPTLTAPGTGLISIRDNDAWGGPPFGLLWDPFVVSNSYAQGDDSGGLPADYMYLTGTSMASPAACGSAALIKQYRPYISAQELIEILKNSARRDDFTTFEPNAKWGFGKIDVYNAVHNLASENNVMETTSEIMHVSNFPNPFNPVTKIAFTLSKDMDVTVEIYNIKGQLIKKLLKKHLQCGNHTIVWNGKDENNKTISSGVYFYKIITSNNSIIKKMLLLK